MIKKVKLILFILFLGIFQSYICYETNFTTIDEFGEFKDYDPDLKACLDKVAELCKSLDEDSDQIHFDNLKKIAFLNARTTEEFHEFYCWNFDKGVPKFDANRKCDPTELQNEVSKYTSCEDMLEKTQANEEEIENGCLALEAQQMMDNVTQDIKDKFETKLAKVISGYKEMFEGNTDILSMLDQIAPTTFYNYRLSEPVAGAREVLSFNEECMWEPEKKEWCKYKLMVVPGGKVFWNESSLELVLAHEIGHFINYIELPENAYQKTMKSLIACNHLDSKKIDIEEARNETSADIYMAKYNKLFMKSQDIQSHFCHYEIPTDYSKASYLHPYHRQALLNCNDLN